MNTKKFDFNEFADIVGIEVVDLIVSHAPTKVISRVAKSNDHFRKAEFLEGIDEEMGSIRLIAAEEELVVAIFEWFKLNAKHFPEHNDFIGKKKNHLVKLAFAPVLQQLSHELKTMLAHGITFDGLENVMHWTATPTILNGRVTLEIRDNESNPILKINPLDVALALKDETDEVVTEQLYQDFNERVENTQNCTVKQFITTRADFRNKILYAEDGGIASMNDKLRDLRQDVFTPTLQLLLWALATLLSNKPISKQWGVLSQFIALYRKVLTEAKLL